MQIGKPFREFDLLAVHGDGAECRLLALHAVGQIVTIQGKEPAYVRAFAFQRARGPLRFAQMRLVAAYGSKHEAEHVEEMHADVGCNAARLGLVALSRKRRYQLAAGCYVGQFDLVTLVAVRKALAQGHNRRMQAELQNRGNRGDR